MKKILFVLGLTLLYFISNAQSSYFYNYKGEKIHLSLNTKHAFLSVKEQEVSTDIKLRKAKHNKLQSDKSDKKQYRKKKNSNRFWTELSFEEKLSDKQYLDMLANIKRKNKDAIVSPYFKFNDSSDDEKIGLSNFFYVKLKVESDTVLLLQMADSLKSVIIEQDPFMPLWHVLSITELSKFNAMESANLFYESGLFQAAEPNLMVDVTQCVNDTHFAQLWGLKNTGQNGGANGIDIKACDVWQISIGNNINIAVIDEGIDLTHPDLAANLHALSYDCTNRTSPSVIRGNHATACAGIIGAVRNNNQGIAGVAPNCRMVSISRFLGDGSVQEPNIQQDLAAGINWAWENGADIISNSWGHNALQGTFITDAINAAVTQGRLRNGVQLGCVVVFSSGNNNASSVNYPASLPNVVAVGAIDRNGQRANFSNYGTALNVVAPGVDIYTTDRQGTAGYNTASGTNGNYYSSFNGTSAACPHVAGIAALILSVRPDLTQAQVRQAIESTCTKLPSYSFSNSSSHPNGTWNEQVGHGLVNAYAAVNSVMPVITGPSEVCTSGNTFALTNTPSGVAVQWNVTRPFDLYGATNTSVNVKKTETDNGTAARSRQV